MLDEFNQPSSSASAPKSTTAAKDSTTNAATSAVSANEPTDRTGAQAAGEGDGAGSDEVLSEDFAKELAQGMQALMKELGGSANTDAEGLMGNGAGAEAGAGAGASGQDFNEAELMRQFEAMMAGFGGAPSSTAGPSTSSAAPAAGANASSSTSATATSKPANFNDAIAATMAKLKESDASATADSATSDNPFANLSGAEGEEMAKLLAALGGSGDLSGLEGAMDNPELTKMLEGMMDELMSRDILYEPLKELRDKYPAYLAGPDSASISAEDRKRYEQQSKYIDEIVRIFEEPGYDDKDKLKAGRVQELMNQMQDCGSPPQEIVGDMPAELENLPGFGGAAGGNEECTIM